MSQAETSGRPNGYPPSRPRPFPLPMRALNIQPTPNPNSLKFTVKNRTFLDGGMASFNGPVEALGHPLGEALFALPGIANVFILPQFLTVTKKPEADWDALLPALERAIEAYFAAREGGG